MNPPALDTISVVLESPGPAANSVAADMGLPSNLRTLDGSRRTAVAEIPVEKLRASMGRLHEQISAILADVKAVGDFKLDEVKLSVELSSEGGVHLIGTLKAGVNGAIELTFKK